MKKTIVLTAVLLVMLLTGCKKAIDPETGQLNDYKITRIAGCEYITAENGWNGSNSYSFAITHKGNCSNPIHVYKEE